MVERQFSSAPQLGRKMQAAKKVWGMIFGTIDTRRTFLDHRLELAQNEWAVLLRTLATCLKSCLSKTRYRNRGITA
ncbi:NapC/NirT family cytochrome c [Phyllobacterium sp. LjRoot231]|uniref:NapC/NirT family cytochrome c n=1 Tax=Phyllobacterium sp. LjRoot231 TaxID=3342289 RepID=UPI003F4F7F7A